MIFWIAFYDLLGGLFDKWLNNLLDRLFDEYLNNLFDKRLDSRFLRDHLASLKKSCTMFGLESFPEGENFLCLHISTAFFLEGIHIGRAIAGWPFLNI